MSANPDSIEKSFSERLSDFDDKIKTQSDNASLLNEIHASLTALMAQSGDRDDEIREILQKRYNAGKLRLETYQLVRNVLDRVVIESMATMPDAVDMDDTDDSFSSTMVITGSSPKDAARQDHLQIGSVLRDRFLLQERVSGGSMGVVYKAHDRRLAEADGFDPWVAIKVLSPRLSRNAHALRALQQEAAKGRCLSHPNIVRFIDLDRDDDVYFIVMEWLEGRSLAAILDENKNRKIDLPTSLDIVRQVGAALDYAHRCGVIHADVKPANIMVTPSGEVKLFDFGIARIRQKQQDGRNNFDPGVLGAITPAYSSIQVLGGEDPTPADDVFSLGCLMYRLVAGHRVFGPRNAEEAADQGMEPQRPQGLSDSQWRALKKSLAFTRVARFATPAEFLQALDVEAEPGPARVRHDFGPFEPEFDGPVLVDAKPRPAERRRNWPIAIAVLALAAVGLTLVSQPELVQRIQETGQSLLERTGVVTAPDVTDGRTPPAAVDGRDVGDEGITDLPPVADPFPAQDGTAGEGTAPQQAPSEPPVRDERIGEAPLADPQSETPADSPPVAGADPGAQTGEQAAPVGQLPPPDAVLALGVPGRNELTLALREGEQDANIELVRSGNLDAPLSVRVQEVGYSGNRSPLESGRYTISGNGVATFEAGQSRSHVAIAMPSDNLRQADAQATLMVRNAADPATALATLHLVLEDDDQRRFEAGLPSDTVGFAVNRIYVNERDPAVQIDVLRYNPSDSDLEVRYFVSGGTATEGEDFFLPGAMGLVFSPGQRSARILIPLVQDSIIEPDETFTLELRVGEVPNADIYRSVEVIIRDDDG